MAAPAPRPATHRPLRTDLLLPALLAALGLFQACSSGAGSAGGRKAGAPVITAVVPSQGSPGSPVTGQPGTRITLGGSGLGLTSAVIIGGQAASFQARGDNQITAVVPFGAQPGPLEVVTDSGTATAAFDSRPSTATFQPAVATFRPVSGPVGTMVTLFGSGLEQIQSVTFTGGASAAADAVWEAQGNTRLLVLVPDGAVTGPITITTAGGSFVTRESFVVDADDPAQPQGQAQTLALTLASPQITGFAPTSGLPGQTVVITGSGFSLASAVSFGGIAVQDFLEPQADQIQVTIPDGLTPGQQVPIAVTTPAGIATTAAPDLFTVPLLPTPPPAPALTGIQPAAQGAPGDTVTLVGNGLLEATRIFFGGFTAPSFTVVDDGHITVDVPAAAQSGPVIVQVAGQVAAGVSFTVVEPVPPLPPPPPSIPPAIDAFAPAAGTPNTLVILTGSGFTGTQEVTFNGVPAQVFMVDSDNQIRTLVPPTAPLGAGPIAVTNGDRRGDTTALAGTPGFTVQAPPPGPVIDAAQTAAAGHVGDAIAIHGTHLLGATAVSFGGRAAPEFTVVSDTEITATVPVGALSGDLTVTTPAGTALPVTFAVTQPVPAITGMDPAHGPVDTTVTLTGTNLGPVSVVHFGAGQLQAVFAPSTDGIHLRFLVPLAATAGSYPVSVQYEGSPTFVPAGTFTVTPPPLAITQPPAPAQGVPGTEVTLTGTGFSGTTQVAYGGAALGADRWDVDGDTQLRVRIPDDAQADGALQVTTPTGVANSSQFILLPSRRALLAQPVQITQTLLAGTQVDFHNGRSDLQNGLGLPLAPVFHPYFTHPSRVVPVFTLNLSFPARFAGLLPPDLIEQYRAVDILPAALNILCVSQNYAWATDEPDAPYLFRPHYWTNDDAPNEGDYSVLSNIRAGLFGLALPIEMDGHGDGVFAEEEIVMAGPGVGEVGLVTPADQRFAMTGLDDQQSTSFWSLVQLETEGAATLHLLFSDADQEVLTHTAEFLAGYGGQVSVSDLLAELDAAGFSAQAEAGLVRLKSLFRAQAGLRSTTPLSADAVTLTLEGTGLADASEALLVQASGRQELPFHPVSDTLLQVTAPAGAQGYLVVTTPYGASDPIDLP